MSTEEAAQVGVTGTEENGWTAGALGGIIGGLAFGAMIQMMMTPVMTNAIPALYGLSGAASGWVIHLFHSVVLGLVYVAVTSIGDIAGYADEWSTGIGVGLAYGLLLWIILAVIVMPLWLSAVGFPNAPGVPNISPKSLGGHLVYGLVLGILYPVIEAQL